jgi:hypothetical protein
LDCEPFRSRSGQKASLGWSSRGAARATRRRLAGRGATSADLTRALISPGGRSRGPVSASARGLNSNYGVGTLSRLAAFLVLSSCVACGSTAKRTAPVFPAALVIVPDDDEESAFPPRQTSPSSRSCPRDAPGLGEPCSLPGQRCDYTWSDQLQCRDDVWQSASTSGGAALVLR